MRNYLAFTTFTLGTALIGILLGTKCSLALPRILGGNRAKPGQFYWAVSLQTLDEDNTEGGKHGYRHDCGGAIVNRWTVITAAHCTWNREAREMRVVAGAHNIKAKEETQQWKKVSNYTMHPNYTSEDKPGPYDVAVLRLASPLKYNDRVGSIDMAKKGEETKGTCDNSGWGNLFPVSPIHYQGSDVLITSKTTIVSMGSCKRSYPLWHEQLGTAVCASAGPLSGTCQGDSGGPLTCFRKDSTPYLAGLVSFGFQVCNAGTHPDVYSDLGHEDIYSFIQSTKAVDKKEKSKRKGKSKNGDDEDEDSNSDSRNKLPAQPGARGGAPLSLGGLSLPGLSKLRQLHELLGRS